MMENSEQKVGKVFLVFAGICILALPFITEDLKPDIVKTEGDDFDQSGEAIFINYDQLSQEYLAGTSTARTLDEYYSRRQYPGAPPYIPHKVEEADLAPVECLTCHAKGGWTADLKKNTPLTPHPEYAACRQCHVQQMDAKLFVDIDWMSITTPRLGRSDLPGAPPPVPHELQMRGNCIACHVGPGAVASIRVEHPSRGNCRQCHVPATNAGLFVRK
ncbi:MAG: nitrate reductase cytochrome c-type subunit [Deltaproteobacteria bacterium]|nr:nitrate reductase cytochrome c-type subunit [Deltaproteobacteria bacterium]